MFKKITILTVFVVAFSVAAFAQEEAKKETSLWNIGGDASVTFLSSSFSAEWSGIDGGQSNITIGALGNAFAKYKKDKVSWDNMLLMQYTTQKTQVNPDFVKTLDKLELLSFAGYTAVRNWDYSMALSVKTQWTPTYLTSKITGERDSVISNFFAPGEILIGPGMKFNKGDKTSKSQLSVNVSPATAKFVIVRDQQIADANYQGNLFNTEFGASILGTYRVKLMENLTYQTNVSLFSNYLEKPQFIDVKWANIISTNLFKIVTINLTYDLRYDHDVSTKVRSATTFGVGLGYKF